MKKVVKDIVFVLICPFFIFINPLTIGIFKKICGAFVLVYNNVFVTHTFGKLHCQHVIHCEEGRKGIVLRGHVSFGRGNRIAAISKAGKQRFHPVLEFGNNVSVGDNCHIAAVNLISIGDDTLIGSNVFIEDHSHGGGSAFYQLSDGIKSKLDICSKGPIIIGKNVWIGEKACILPNVKIGDNSVIGAGSVVTHDVEANSIYAGNPARKIR